MRRIKLKIVKIQRKVRRVTSEEIWTWRKGEHGASFARMQLFLMPRVWVLPRTSFCHEFWTCFGISLSFQSCVVVSIRFGPSLHCKYIPLRPRYAFLLSRFRLFGSHLLRPVSSKATFSIQSPLLFPFEKGVEHRMSLLYSATQSFSMNLIQQKGVVTIPGLLRFSDSIDRFLGPNKLVATYITPILTQIKW
jgi:hypothetical protein